MEFVDDILRAYCICMQASGMADPVVRLDMGFTKGTQMMRGTAVVHNRYELEVLLCQAVGEGWTEVEVGGFDFDKG